MRKVIIGITSVVLCLSVVACGYFFIQYNSFNKEKKDIKKVEDNIKSIDKEISKVNEEINSTKENNKEKVELLEVWEKELGKVKKDS